MKSLFRCLIVVFATTGATAGAAVVDLVILAGQSNMVGQASVSEAIPGSVSADSRVAYYYDVKNTSGSFSDSSGRTFTDLAPWRRGSSDLRFGPEMSLGRTLHSAGFNPALVKVAVGGSEIARWQPGAVDYELLRSSVREAIDQIRASGDTVNLLGMAWLQGESDAISTARADAYAGRLNEFIGGFRSELESELPAIGFAEAKLFLVEPADWANGSSPGLATPADTAKVNNALTDFASADANAYFVPTDDFTSFGDNLIHFGPADQLTLGARLADAIIGSTVPEPSGMLVAGFGVLVAMVRRRQRPETAEASERRGASVVGRMIG